MTIRERGYHSWDGELRPNALKWLPMFRGGIKTAFAKRHSKTLFGFCVLPFLVFLVGIYVSTRPELKMFTKIAGLLENEGLFFNEFFTNGILFLQVLLGAFIGAELISQDIKFNSFPLYFSRPLDRKDYIHGKYSILLFYFLLFSWLPGILLLVFKVLFTGKLAISPRVFLALNLMPLLMAFFLSSLVLLFSSFSRSGKHVKVVIFITYFLSMPLARLLREIFGSSYFYLLSIKENLRQMGTFLFGLKPVHSYPAWLAPVVVVLITLGAHWLLYRRIGKLEAQIENSN